MSWWSLDGPGEPLSSTLLLSSKDIIKEIYQLEAMILRYYIDNLVLNDDRSASNDQEVTKLYGMTTIRTTNFLRLFHHLEPKFHDISTKLISPFFYVQHQEAYHVRCLERRGCNLGPGCNVREGWVEMNCKQNQNQPMRETSPLPHPNNF